LRPLIWLTLLALPIHSALAWGGDGHRIVGDIASRHLTPQAALWVADLLEQSGESNPTLASVSTWADQVRGSSEWNYTAPWHYVNLPMGGGFTYDAGRDCPTEGCVVEAIALCRAVLEAEDTESLSEPEALMFLDHFIGDLHQPLHAGYEEDRGGNSIRVTFFGQSRNLHSVWDSGIIGQTGREWEDYADLLDARLTPQQIADWSTLDEEAWTNQSYDLAVEYAYSVSEGDNLGDAYQALVLPIVEQQLQRGGLRLAATLNAIFESRTDMPPMPSFLIYY